MDLSKYHRRLKNIEPIRAEGKIVQVIGLIAESDGPVAEIGELCLILSDPNDPGGGVPAEVVGFRSDRVLLMPLATMQGIKVGSRVISSGRPLMVGAGHALLGRILNGLGHPIDGGPNPDVTVHLPLDNDPPNPLTRRRITTPITMGVRAIDCLLTCGEGQRLGIFAGSGVGKSTTLGMIARNTSADVNVIALIGERGREVRDFIERDLGEEGLKRSVLVVATSDQPALQRLKGAFVATAIAEYFR
ncbi:MAG TPA: EscN/YscN/HrcN family type III secretion system ATPase, partial [Chroococcales cyanobacterium]